MSSRRVRPLAAFALAAPALAALSLIGAGAAPAAIGPRDRHLFSGRQGISVEAPAGWTLSQHTGYGETIALLLHPDGSRITVTAATTTAPDTAALFQQNRPGLLAQGLPPVSTAAGPRGFFAVDIEAPRRAERIRQLYLVREIPEGRQAVILTLVSRASVFAAQTPALDFVASRLGLEDPVLPLPSVASGGAGTAGSTGQLGAPAPKRVAPAKDLEKH